MSTVTTNTSWFSRIGSSVKGVILGVLFIIGAIIFIFWNEGRAVQTYESLIEGSSVVNSVSAENINSANEGKLVHFSGNTTTSGVISDAEFLISSESLRLRRIVEVYQWSEKSSSKTTEKLGGGTETTTTYSYEKKWSDQVISSANFKEAETHQNPNEKLFENKDIVAQSVTVGAFSIPEDMIKNLSGWTQLPLTQEMFNALSYEEQEKINVVSNTIYYSVVDPTKPEIGDTRIRYEVIPVQEVSVMGAQSGNTVIPFKTKNNQTISMINVGNISAESMFEGAIEGNKILTFIFRIIGFLVIFIGFNMILQPLRVFVSVIPLFGRIVGFGNSIIATIFTLTTGTVVIAIAWIVARPLLSFVLIGLVVAGFIGIAMVGKKNPVVEKVTKEAKQSQ